MLTECVNTIRVTVHLGCFSLHKCIFLIAEHTQLQKGRSQKTLELQNEAGKVFTTFGTGLEVPLDSLCIYATMPSCPPPADGSISIWVPADIPGHGWRRGQAGCYGFVLWSSLLSPEMSIT